MKILLIVLAISPLIVWSQQQVPEGTIVVEQITSPSLINAGGENPTRRVTVYLPPGYQKSITRYPVIYYLHGFTWSDSLQIASDRFDELLDKAIATRKIRPVIVVIPNQHTLYKGSFYTNSTLIGNWSDFTSKDLVQFIDKKYRTIPNKNSRGITGHSMGGHGAIKNAILHPEVFSCVYALSPGALLLAKEIGPRGNVFKEVSRIATTEELLKTFLPLSIVAKGRAFSPNPSKPPFYCDLPFTYTGDSLIVNDKVLKLWHKNLPYYMVDDYLPNLRKLTAIKFDWGRNEDLPHIPLTCLMFSQKLENAGIEHYAEEYIGTHSNKIWTEDGRTLNDMLPFFNTYLDFKD